ncbi:MAG: hypothetical protein ACOYIN_04550 [Christensenellales bacterium]|jgi:hypothetical protein|nr:hypothetical protein [Clostridia bacterium]HRU84295.1 hypothetical protein [Eubacteriales bacterium]
MALDRNTLTKKEKALMVVVYEQAMLNNGACLLSPTEIFEKLPLELEFRATELEPTLKVLELDDYFDVTTTDKKGELIYCINLHQKGLAFAREEVSFKRSLRFKITLTIICAILTAVISLIVRWLLQEIIG